jgi:hypothetical protein
LIHSIRFESFHFSHSANTVMTSCELDDDV